MRIPRLMTAGLLGLILIGRSLVLAGIPPMQNDPEGPSKLMVLWTSGDREVALKMVFMYTFNAKKRGWWDQIRFVIWGPSSKLLSEDQELQKGIKDMQEAGVEVQACKACADQYGVSDKLTALGIEVKYMGVPLTDMLKGGWASLTF
ncbi:MAG: DsrE family protein [Candidatus Aminicenantaceae bacterium]